MRFLAIASIALLICICLIVVVLAITQYRQWRRGYLEQHSQWVDVVVNSHGTTYVSVQRVTETLFGRVVLDEQHIGFVSHDNPEWTTKVMELQAKAWDRTIVLNGITD
jgi:hypothetical protein